MSYLCEILYESDFVSERTLEFFSETILTKDSEVHNIQYFWIFEKTLKFSRGVAKNSEIKCVSTTLLWMCRRIRTDLKYKL